MTAKASTSSAEKSDRRLGLSPRSDIVLSIVFLVLGAILVIALVLPALFLAMAADGCMGDCVVEVMGFYWALVTPSLAWLTTLITTIVLLVRQRPAWLFTLLGGAAVFVTFLVGVALVFAPQA